MKILFAAAEAAPFVKSGGLGDVAQALPRALSKIKDNEVAVFLPYYKSIRDNPAVSAEYVTNFRVRLAWRELYAGVFRTVIKNTGVGKNKRNDLVFYFIDNEYYFARDGLYGYPDDGERFAFFSKAVAEAVNILGFFPDVVHANDWQTGFLPLFLKYSGDARARIKTVYTIHNIEYQGKADPDFTGEVLGVDGRAADDTMFDGLVNAMKCAIVLSDKVTTVSKTYAHEIRYAYYAHGLHDILSQNAYKLRGIVNGIDTKEYCAETDPHIPAHFTPRDLSGKRECKKALLSELGLSDDGRPIVAIISRLVAHKGMELVECVGEEILSFARLVVLGTGDSRFENYFRYLGDRYPDSAAVRITFDAGLASRIYAGADLFLMPSKSEPCGLSQMIAMRYGTIPIVRETGGLVDTVTPIDPVRGTGRGITFKVFNAHDMLDAVRRGCAVVGDRALYEKIAAADMRADLSWSVSAEEYMQIYSE